MMTKRLVFPFAVVFLLSAVLPGFIALGPGARAAESITVVGPQQASVPEQLAAKEIRRYLYLRTGQLVPIVSSSQQPAGKCIIVAEKSQPVIAAVLQRAPGIMSSIRALRPQQYLLKTVALGSSDGKPVLLVVGGDPVGTLYGAYRLAEHFGVRFYLHGDVVPDGRTTLFLPSLDERGVPLFRTRGIQPFHDFPEGPDWWNADDYKAVLAQLPKLRMNFIGLHTYPQGGVGPEPTVWIGLEEDVLPDGTVQFGSPSSYQNTLRGNWGYAATKTSAFSFGTAQLFERDDYGPEVMAGAMPWPDTPEKRNAVFNRTGRMLGEAFQFAHILGVQTCVGTETPLSIPDAVKERLRSKGRDPSDPAVVRAVYEGMFARIGKTYPLDYYWFWTPESWTWGNPKEEEINATVADLKAALEAAKNARSPFILATCGWVLGPPKDRALFDNFLPKEMPMTCINRNVGFAPVEVGFARVKGRPTWAIPWLEDDPALLVPQLWVGRMRRDAADALAYGCTGLLGIHWRTRILGPNVSALAKAAWEQKPWNADLGREIAIPDPKNTEGREGGTVAAFPNNAIADTEQDALYQTVTYDMKVYRLKVPNGTYTVRLQFCEPHYNEAGKRVFGVTLQGHKAIAKLDVFAAVGKDRALDYTFPGVEVTGGMLEIEFDSVVEFPCIAAFVVTGPGVTRKVNCGGPAYADYEADLPRSDNDPRPRDLPTDDFYADWAKVEFGPAVAEPVARLFARLDGGPDLGIGKRREAYLPRPATWVDGPGGIQPDNRPWEQVQSEYAFVDEMAALRPQVKSLGYLERFDYWLNSFRYLKAVGEIDCTWARYNAALEKIRQEQDKSRQKELAAQTALPIRKELVRQVEEAHRLLLATITTTGGMGTVANWQQHLLPRLLMQPGRELSEILGEALPADAMPASSHDGPARLIVPTVRTSLAASEDLRLKVIALGLDKPAGSALYWRPLGKGEFAQVPLAHVARSVYSVRLPASQIAGRDIEYYVQVSAGGNAARFPVTAPAINQAVVVLPGAH
jgi:hypothetical protein